MERYESHTRHCRSCSGAWRRLAVLRGICELVVVAALAVIAWQGPGVPAAAALITGAAALALRTRVLLWIEGLQRGPGLPPRNRISRRG